MEEIKQPPHLKGIGTIFLLSNYKFICVKTRETGEGKHLEYFLLNIAHLGFPRQGRWINVKLLENNYSGYMNNFETKYSKFIERINKFLEEENK